MKNLDELLDYIKDYYNNKLAETNEGYFPGQGKPDDQVGGYSDLETASNEINIKIEDNIKFEDEELYKENVSEEELILKKTSDIFFNKWFDPTGSKWVSIFNNKPNRSFLIEDEYTTSQFEIDEIKSPFKNGNYIYIVVPGNSNEKPTVIIADLINPTKYNRYYKPLQ